MKNVIVFLVVSVLSLSLLQSAYGFSGSGSGTELDPYIITNINQLQEMKDGLNAWYKLANDVSASETVKWDWGKGFLPVGDSGHGFAGHLKGDGHIISNLYISRSSTDYVGLFGKTDGAFVENVMLADSNIKGQNWTGALVGYSNNSSIDNITLTDPKIRGNDRTGVLVGYSSNSSITNCSSVRAAVRGNNGVGGLLGWKEGGTIAGCSSHQPTVTGTSDNCGGLVGYRSGGTMVGCSSHKPTVTAAGNQCGGLVGQCPSTTIIDCQCIEADISGPSNVGGLVGAMSGSISDSSVDASVNATGDYCGGLVGRADGGGNITNCHSVGIVVGRSYVGGLIGYKSGDIVSNCSSQASPTATGDNCGGLLGGVNGVNITSCHSTGWVVGNNNVGGLVGVGGCWWGSAISRCYATGNVEGYQRVGGLVGGFYCCNATYSYSTGTVYGTNIVGGFVGYNENSSINRCFSTGDSASSDVDCGGFVGVNAAGTGITDCFAAGSVNGGSNFVGGFAGEIITGATTANCYSVGTVSGTFNFGGFAGYNSGTCSDCFWDVDTSGVGVSGCGTGKTTVEMMKMTTFVPPWNFATIWGIFDAQTYPFLMELSPVCGDPWHPYPIGDLNYDCYVDFYDFAEFASNWLECTDPNCVRAAMADTDMIRLSDTTHTYSGGDGSLSIDGAWNTAQSQDGGGDYDSSATVVSQHNFAVSHTITLIKFRMYARAHVYGDSEQIADIHWNVQYYDGSWHTVPDSQYDNSCSGNCEINNDSGIVQLTVNLSNVTAIKAWAYGHTHSNGDSRTEESSASIYEIQAWGPRRLLPPF